MKAFGSEPENRKPRTPTETLRRIRVLAMRTYTDIGLSGEETDYREDLKRRCAQEQIPYDSFQIESALRRARGLRCRNGRASR